MKRFLFWFVVTILVVAAVRSHHRPGPQIAPFRTVIIREKGPDGRPNGRWIEVADHHGRSIVSIENREKTEDRDDDRDADFDADRDTPDRHGRVDADGLPVRVLPGTVVTEALIEPPAPPEPPKPPQPPKAPKRPKARARPFVAQAPRSRPTAPPDAKGETKTVVGQLSATEDRARNDARDQLVKGLSGWVTPDGRSVKGWLEPDIPRTWKVPDHMVDAMIREVRYTPIEKDYGTVYEAKLTVDSSPVRRDEIVEVYRQGQTVNKLTVLGGLLGFVLVCLGTLSGYIRADEATKGYYTNRLRLAAAAGVGAAGVLIYQMVG